MLIASIVGLVLAVQVLKIENRSMAIAGLITSILGVVYNISLLLGIYIG